MQRICQQKSLPSLKMAVYGLSHQHCPMPGLCDGEENQEMRKCVIRGGWAEALGQAEQRWMCSVSTKVIAQ